MTRCHHCHKAFFKDEYGEGDVVADRDGNHWHEMCARIVRSIVWNESMKTRATS